MTESAFIGDGCRLLCRCVQKTEDVELTLDSTLNFYDYVDEIIRLCNFHNSSWIAESVEKLFRVNYCKLWHNSGPSGYGRVALCSA